MGADSLSILDRPALSNARLVLGFSGWMDGGEISTGTVDYLHQKFNAAKLAEIDPSRFYLYSFPGSMELAALFRPYAKIEEGLITRFVQAQSVFHCAPAANLVLFTGKEPNLAWGDYADCILTLARTFDVRLACFVGSVGGLVPHTRDPRLFSSVSDPSLLPLLDRHGLAPSEYEGPASFAAFLTQRAKEQGLPLLTLVAEIPAYVQGRNVRVLAAVVRKLATILELDVDLTDVNAESRRFESKLNETLRKQPKLAEQVRKIERDFDREVFSEIDEDDLKAWLDKQGIRLE